ncbi:MAG: bifunctional nuclease family protein, partial [Calditrichaeota bacterium]
MKLNYFHRIALVIVLQLLWAQSCTHGQTENPVQMKFKSMEPLPGRKAVVIILAEKDGSRILPIYIDENQALSIYLGQSGKLAERPLTHDLLANVLQKLKAKLDRVVISKLQD